MDTNKACWAPSDTPPTRPPPTTPLPNSDKSAASRAATRENSSTCRGRGSRTVSLDPSDNDLATPAGPRRAVRAQGAIRSTPAKGGAHRPLAASAEDEGDLEARPVRLERDRTVDLRDSPAVLATPRARPIGLRRCCAADGAARASWRPSGLRRSGARMAWRALWPPDRSRATVRARRRHSADAHGRPKGGNSASRRTSSRQSISSNFGIQNRRRACTSPRTRRERLEADLEGQVAAAPPLAVRQQPPIGQK